MKQQSKESKLKPENNYTIHQGIYYKNKDGMGGTAIDSVSGIKISIPALNENFALDKDQVEVQAKSDKNGQLLGHIKKIIKRNTTHLVGFIQKYKTKYLLNVTNLKFGNYLVLINSAPKEINREEIYNTVIVTYPDLEQHFFEVAIVNSIGKIGEDKAFIAELIIEAALPVEFSAKALAQADKVSDEINPQEINNRVDLRHLNFVTIDGEDAKDFDDAVYCEMQNGLFNLYVAIADVAHYVTSGSALDIDAYDRGTSVYFPNRVIPMLPKRLSNGLCSLNPHVDRLVMCCEMQIKPNGEIVKYKVYNGVINSKARLTYNQVQVWLDSQDTPTELRDNINNLYQVFQALLTSRTLRGAIDFDTIEPFFVFNEQNVVTEIKSRTRLDAHKLIEECMLAANVCVAEFLFKEKQDTLYRIHDKPSEEKFNNLKEYLNSLAIKFDIKYENLKPKDYANLLIQVKETHKEDFPVIQNAILRSMQLAIYAPQNLGHFGLSYAKYLHFTSPIRRYPDLLVHRGIKEVIKGNHYSYSHPLNIIGEQTSFTERRAEDLSRKVQAFYKCQYAKTHIGSEFDGIITTVTSFGLFVYIASLMLDGLVHITGLGSEYFIFDDKKQILVGKKTGIKYVTGQIIKIEIAGVDMAKLFIDFKLVC